MSRRTFDLSLGLVVGPSHVEGDPLPLLWAAVAGGVTLVQYRDKTSETRAMVSEVRRLKQALDGNGVPLLVNDRVDVALAAGADGVHVGQEDMAPADARRLLGPNRLVGLTVKGAGQARAIDPDDVDYASIGGVFETVSKYNIGPPIGLDGLRDIVAALDATVPQLKRCAISGINTDRAGPVVACGLDGVYVVSAITQCGDPAWAARTLRNAVDAARCEGERAIV